MTMIALFIIVLLFAVITNPQAKPLWVEHNGRNNLSSSSKIVSGFGLSSCNRCTTLSQKIGIARARARADLVKKLGLSIQIKSHFSTHSSNGSDGTFDIDSYSEIVEEYSSIHLSGLETKIYYRNKKSPVYALAVLNLESARTDHLNKWKSLREEHMRMISLADSLMGAGAEIKALETLLGAKQIEQKLSKQRESLYLLGIVKKYTPLEDASKDTVTSLMAGMMRLLYVIYDDLHSLKGILHFTFSQADYPEWISGVNIPHTVSSLIEKHTNLSPILPIALSKGIISPYEALIRASVRGADYSAHISVQRYSRNFIITMSVYSVTHKTMVAGSRIAIVPTRHRDITKRHPIKIWSNHGEDTVHVSMGDTLRLYLKSNQQGYIRVLYKNDDGRFTVIDPKLLNCYIDDQNLEHEKLLVQDLLVTKPHGMGEFFIIYSPHPFKSIDPCALEYDSSSYFAMLEGNKSDLSDHNSSVSNITIIMHSAKHSRKPDMSD